MLYTLYIEIPNPQVEWLVANNHKLCVAKQTNESYTVIWETIECVAGSSSLTRTHLSYHAIAMLKELSLTGRNNSKRSGLRNSTKVPWLTQGATRCPSAMACNLPCSHLLAIDLPYFQAKKSRSRAIPAWHLQLEISTKAANSEL